MNKSIVLKPEPIIEIDLPCKPGYERIAMSGLAALARQYDCPKARIEDLKTVVAEAVIFAIDQGNTSSLESRVTVWSEVEKDTIHVSVVYEGKGISAEILDPDSQGLIEGNAEAVGLGVFLIRELADSVEFDRMGDGRYVVRMTIRMRPVAEARRR
jgi:anti-sigma regulatory factor (Ser/Thr protein kinase)